MTTFMPTAGLFDGSPRANLGSAQNAASRAECRPSATPRSSPETNRTSASAGASGLSRSAAAAPFPPPRAANRPNACASAGGIHSGNSEGVTSSCVTRAVEAVNGLSSLQ